MMSMLSKENINEIFEDIKKNLTRGVKDRKHTFHTPVFCNIDNENNIHGAFTVEITNFPNERIAFTTSVGGKGITEQGLWNQYEQWLKNNGVTMIRGAAHETVARLWRRKFGVQSRYIIVEKKL